MAANNANVNNAIIMLKDFDVTKINFETVNRNARNGKSVRITYGPQKQPIRIQLPELYVPFDLKEVPDDSRPGESNYTFEAALQGYDEEGNKVCELYNKLKQLDDVILQACVDKSVDWLGSKKEKDVVEEFYRKIVRQNNPKYSPLIRIKVTKINMAGDMPKVFDKASNNNACVPVTTLVKGSRVRLIITIPSVWLVNKNFGVTLKMYQACITYKPSLSLDDYAFKDDDDEPGAEDGHSDNTLVDTLAQESE